MFGELKSNEYTGHKKPVFSLDWNCSGQKLASGSSDSSIRIWNLGSNAMEKGSELKGHSDMVDQIGWHPNNDSIIASASSDSTLRIWDVKSGKCIKNEKTKGSNINLAWSHEGNMVAVGNRDDIVSFYDFRHWKLFKNINFKTEVNEFCWDKTSSIFLITTSNGQIQVLNGKTLATPPLMNLQAHSGPCLCITVDPQGRYFATGGADSLICLWDTMELCCIKTLSKLDWQLRQLSFSYDGKFIAAASKESMVEILDTETDEQVHTIQCKSSQHTVSWHPKKYLLAYAGDEKGRSGGDEGSVHVFGFS